MGDVKLVLTHLTDAMLLWSPVTSPSREEFARLGRKLPWSSELIVRRRRERRKRNGLICTSVCLSLLSLQPKRQDRRIER